MNWEEKGKIGHKKQIFLSGKTLNKIKITFFAQIRKKALKISLYF